MSGKSVQRDLSVVIPALNEEHGVGETLGALRAAMSNYPGAVEYIVVDDGSTDQTASRAAAAGAHVISHPKSGGYGRALKTGIEFAKHDLVAICDADGTYPVEELVAMTALMDRYDSVIGQRTGPYYRRALFRSPLRSSFLLLTSFVTGTWIPDPNSGLRLFRRSDVIPLLPRLPRAFSFTTTLTLIMTLGGQFVHYHPIAYRRRIGRSKVRLLRDALRVGQTMVEVVLEHNPLKMFLVVMLPIALAALGAAIASFFDPRALVPAVILFCTAALVFTAGMLAVVVLGPDRRVR